MDLTELLSSLSEQDMAMLKNVASSLGGKSAESEDPPKKAESAPEPTPFGNIDLSSVGSIASLLSKFSGTSSDPRCNLIMSLKPLLSPERQKRADEAVKILRLIDLLPALRESGILKGVL